MRLRPLGCRVHRRCAEKRVEAAQAVLFTKGVHTGRTVVKIGSTARFEAVRYCPGATKLDSSLRPTSSPQPAPQPIPWKGRHVICRRPAP